MNDRLEFRHARNKQLLLLLVGCALVAGSAFMLKNPDDIVDRIIGWFGVVFFSLCALIAIKRLITGGSPFVFDRSGIAFQTGNLGLIPWADIESFGILTLRGNRLLTLTFRDPERTLARVSAAKRKWALANKAMGWGHWSVSFAGISPGLDEAVAFISQHVPTSV